MPTSDSLLTQINDLELHRRRLWAKDRRSPQEKAELAALGARITELWDYLRIVRNGGEILGPGRHKKAKHLVAQVGRSLHKTTRPSSEVDS